MRTWKRSALLQKHMPMLLDRYHNSCCEPVNISASRGDAALRLPAIHLVFSLVKRWLLGTHHGAVGEKHLPAYLDEYVFRFNRRTAGSISHGFARLVEHAVMIRPTTYRAIVAAPTPA